MSGLAFVFPGQGAQYIGMGRDFFEKSKTAAAVFAQASEAAGLDIPALCFEENDRLPITEYTQIAMLTVEVAALKTLEEAGITADTAAGLSLGEYAAVVAAGAMEPSDAFRVVRQRGIFMQEAVPVGGAMAAVLGLTGAQIEEVLAGETSAGNEGQVSIANYNCPGQIVITGEGKAVARAGEALQAAGARKVVALKVSGPFHSPMMEGAGEKLAAVLQMTPLKDCRIPYIANLTADYVRETKEIRPLLVKQVSGSVRWQQSIERMLQDGITTFAEIGPGRTIAGFIRKISKEARVINIEHYEDFEKNREELQHASN